MRKARRITITIYDNTPDTSALELLADWSKSEYAFQGCCVKNSDSESKLIAFAKSGKRKGVCIGVYSEKQLNNSKTKK